MTRHWNHSFDASPTCRIEAGPSRLLVMCIGALGVFGVFSLGLSEFNWLAVAAGSTCAAAYAALAIRTELRQPTRAIAFGTDGRVESEGVAVDAPRLDWQGPIGIVSWQQGSRRRRLVLWPDLIDSAQRRELRLWALSHRADARTPAVAP